MGNSIGCVCAKCIKCQTYPPYDYRSTLAFASDDLRADEDVVLAALTQEGCALEFAAEALRSDETVVSIAVKKDGYD